MRSVKAVFNKQYKSVMNSPETLIQFAIFPFLAFMMARFVNLDVEGVPYYIAELIQANQPNMVTMQAVMFAGMALIPSVAGIIAEDIEKKSLRFLVMAGVKPVAYLVGIGSVMLAIALVPSVAFAWIAGYSGQEFALFTAAMMSGVAASIVMGATVGILAGNQQSATAISMPLAMVFGFGPMMAQFIEPFERVLRITYTQQLNIVADYFDQIVDTPLWQSFAIMWANVAVLGIVFAVVYAKKGMKG